MCTGTVEQTRYKVIAYRSSAYLQWTKMTGYRIIRLAQPIKKQQLKQTLNPIQTQSTQNTALDGTLQGTASKIMQPIYRSNIYVYAIISNSLGRVQIWGGTPGPPWTCKLSHNVCSSTVASPAQTPLSHTSSCDKGSPWHCWSCHYSPETHSRTGHAEQTTAVPPIM